MSNIEKLGIKMPFDGNDGCYLYAEKGTDKIVINMETNKVLWAAPEMLEALIENVNIYTNTFDDGENCEFIVKQIAIIEKATGKSWEEIKALID